MDPLWELLETAITGAQDDISMLTEEEEEALEKLRDWLRENDIRTTNQLD